MAEEADWGNGLPVDVMDMISRCLDREGKVALRCVSHGWQESCDRCVSKLKLRFVERPFSTELAGRFPGLTDVNIGACSVGPEALQALAGLRRQLVSLSLGKMRGYDTTRIPEVLHGEPPPLPSQTLALRVSDLDVVPQFTVLTTLDLTG